MNVKSKLWVGFYVLLVVLTGGCDNKTDMRAMPAVNEENCRTENIKKIEDAELRQRFADACFRM